MQEIRSIEVLDFSIGGYATDYRFEIKVEGDIASFAKHRMPLGMDPLTSITLEAKKMNSFIRSLNRLGVLDWEEYYSTAMLDGTQWHLELEYNEGSKFSSGGSNAYPGMSDRHSSNQSPEFAQLKRVLVRLIQQPGFFR